MRSPMQYFRGVRHPEGYHGRGRIRAFFEGWYIKLASPDLSQRWALIPGIFRGDSTDGSVDEAFIQVLDGVSGRSWYFPFAPDEFAASEDRMAVTIGANRFDKSGVMLDLPMISGSLSYATPIDPYPVTLRRPGIMGWYGYLPIMECFHGIVSFGHDLAGTLVIEDKIVEFADGRGYIEKDWGTAFPSSYVWLASNHLRDAAGAEIAGSLVASCAIIPGVGRTFRGSIVALRYPDRLATWATWNGSRDDELTIDDSHVRWRIHGPDGTRVLAPRRAGVRRCRRSARLPGSGQRSEPRATRSPRRFAMKMVPPTTARPLGLASLVAHTCTGSITPAAPLIPSYSGQP